MIRVFGEALGDEPGSGARAAIDPEAIELFAPSWVRAAKPYNEDHFAVAEQENALRMMSNESPYTPSPRVVQAIVEAALRGNCYPAGTAVLRQKLGQRDGLGESNVLLGAGSTELIDLVIRCFVAPGEEVLLSVPTFSMYEARTRVVGGIPVLVPMTEDQEHDVIGADPSGDRAHEGAFPVQPEQPDRQPHRRRRSAAAAAPRAAHGDRRGVLRVRLGYFARPSGQRVPERDPASHVFQGVRARRDAPRLHLGAPGGGSPARARQGAVEHPERHPGCCQRGARRTRRVRQRGSPSSTSLSATSRRASGECRALPPARATATSSWSTSRPAAGRRTTWSRPCCARAC